MRDITNRSNVSLEVTNSSVLRVVGLLSTSDDCPIYNNKQNLAGDGNSNGESNLYANFRNRYYSDYILLKIDSENKNEIDSIDIGTFGK